MSPEKEDLLIAKYRELYPPDEIWHDETKSCMAWGLEVGDGWFDLIDKAFSKLMLLNPRPQLAQVKSKFGGIRIYLDDSSDEAFAIVNEAEIASEKTCEICGKPASLGSQNGWYSTLCDEHRSRK